MERIGYLNAELFKHYKESSFEEACNYCGCGSYIDTTVCIDEHKTSFKEVSLCQDRLEFYDSSCRNAWSDGGEDYFEKKAEKKRSYGVFEHESSRFIDLANFYEIVKSLGELYGFTVEFGDASDHEEAPDHEGEIGQK